MRGSITISTPNKTQQYFYLKENNINIESRVQSLLNENCILNQQLEQARFQIDSYQQFQEIKQRVLKLEQFIDNQQNEIEKWKLKYQKAAAGETEIQKMEVQILNVIEENERLNQLNQKLNDQLQVNKNQISSLQNTIQQQDIELKQYKKGFEKTNKQAVQWNAFQNDKKSSKQTEIHYVKVKQNDQEQIAIKKNDQICKQCKQCQQKSNQENFQLYLQITKLENDNQELQIKVNELDTKLQDQIDPQSKETQLNFDCLRIELQEQIQNQQQFIQEEMQKYQQCQQQMNLIKEQLIQQEQFFKSLNTQIQNDQNKFNEQILFKFQIGSKNCLRILEQLKNK